MFKNDIFACGLRYCKVGLQQIHPDKENVFLFTHVFYKCIANCFLVGDVCKRTQVYKEL